MGSCWKEKRSAGRFRPRLAARCLRSSCLLNGCGDGENRLVNIIPRLSTINQNGKYPLDSPRFPCYNAQHIMICVNCEIGREQMPDNDERQQQILDAAVNMFV